MGQQDQQDHQIEAASKLFRQRLAEGMKRLGLKGQKAAARHLGIGQSSISEYLGPKRRLPSPDVLRRIREKVTEITEQDAAIIGIGYSRRISISGSTGKTQPASKVRSVTRRANQAVANNLPTSDNSLVRDAEICRVIRQLVRLVDDQEVTTPLVANPLDLLSVMKRYDVGDMASVLTKENFQHMDVSQWTDEQKNQFIEYANQMFDEARKCLMLLAQFQPDSIRDELLERVGRNADLLWRTYKVASSVAPIEYVGDIDLSGKCRTVTTIEGNA